MAIKLLSARASIRTALQAPAVTKFIQADNPDEVKVGKKPRAIPKASPTKGLSMALTGQF